MVREGLRERVIERFYKENIGLHAMMQIEIDASM